VKLKLSYLFDIEEHNEIDRAMFVQAGVALQSVQERVQSVGLTSRLDLGAHRSATIGGNIATNAGGNSVIR